MHSASIFLLAFGLLVTVAMARPGRRPGSGHHQENTENQVSQGQHGQKWLTYRLPTNIRLPHLLAGRLGRPYSTYFTKKILDGKYLLITPALIFKLKDVNNDTDISTTPNPISPTTDEPDVDETTTAAIDEETTTEAVDEESTTSEEIDEENTTPTPTFFKKRSFSINDYEKLLFPDD